MTQRLLALDAEAAAEFVNSVLQVEEGAGSLLDRDRRGDEDGREEGVGEFLRHVGRMPDVLRANIYALDGTVRWSTDAVLVGRRFGDNPELLAAGAGRPTFALGVAGDEDDPKDEHLALARPGQRFVENYLPLFRDGRPDGGVVGVAEIYRSPQAVFDAIRAGQLQILASAATGGLLILAALCWLVRRADRVMRRQDVAITEAEHLATAGEMASAVAHGIRNPLASIRSSAELALELGLPEEVRSVLGEVVADADRLERWVRQYLEATEEAGGDRAALASVLGTVRASLAAELERRGVVWREALDPGLPAVGIGPAPLGQVLHNLVANGIDAMPEGGTITATARLAGDGTVELRVADTGRGMGPEELGRAFVPFASTKGSGLGLGLALTRRILERRGAGVALESAPGLGTVATLRLPPT